MVQCSRSASLRFVESILYHGVMYTFDKNLPDDPSPKIGSDIDCVAYYHLSIARQHFKVMSSAESPQVNHGVKSKLHPFAWNVIGHRVSNFGMPPAGTYAQPLIQNHGWPLFFRP